MIIELKDKKCVACEGGVPPLSGDELENYLKQVPEWNITEDRLSIYRNFKFKDFKEAMGFINQVADLAEREGHHPDISISWNKVNLTLSTHAIGGLSENDLILASKIDLI